MALKRNQKTENAAKHRIIKKVIALALLPQNKFEAGLNCIVAKCQKKFPRDRNLFQFLDYVRRQWQNKDISVFDQSSRTNNCVGSYHRVINKKLVTRPHLSVFLGKHFV